MLKLETNNENLIFIGIDKYEEEFYLDLRDNHIRGWTFMGLRPETEKELRNRARETEPEDLGIETKEINQWFDYETFADDMENDWYEGHNVQAEREEDGETIYLGSGSRTDIFHYFGKEKIKNYKDYNSHFEEIGLNKKDFNFLNKLIKENKEKRGYNMTDKEKLTELELVKNYFLK